MDKLTIVNEQALVFENNGDVVTDSLTVAEMFGKRHDHVMTDIRKQMEYAGKEFSLLNFRESNYRSRGKEYPKYDLTEEAFTLVAMSYNTKEAVQMKIKFIEEFKRMKQHIQNQQKIPNDPMSILKLTFKALEGQSQEIQVIKSDVKDLRENAPLFAIECDEISNAVKRCGVTLLGGKTSNAYRNKSIRGKVYQDIYRQLRRQFNVKSHKAIKRRHLEVAKNIVADYKLPIVLSEEISMVNSQMDFSEI
ncbi:phage regulatory protein [Bacillus cereus]|nr:phage regulatory protein [Bacillus cereus]PGU70935.1 phage regulatory protein [Bacillus cereus]